MLWAARYQKCGMDKRHPTRKASTNKRHGFGEFEPVTIVIRQNPPHGNSPMLLDETRRLYVPAFFEAGFVYDAFSGLPAVWLSIGPGTFEGDPPACSGVRVISAQEPITPDVFRRIPLARYLRLALAAAAGSKEEISRPWAKRELRSGRIAGGKEAAHRERKVNFDDVARVPVGRPRIEEVVDLELVASIAAGSPDSPNKAVREHFDRPERPVSDTTARRWRDRARDAGY